MRRTIVLTLLLTAAAAASAAAIGTLAFAGSAGAATQIVCPQQRSDVIPCCGPPVNQPDQPHAQPICCQTTPCCAKTQCCTTTCCPASSGSACCPTAPCVVSGLTISASPSPSRAGQKVVISGTAGAGATVALWREPAGQSSFHQIASTTAGASGKYTFTRGRGTVMADQKWYVSSNGAQSQTITQQVAAVVALASSTRATAVGRKIVLSGHVTPSHAGQVVSVEMSRGSAWKVIGRPRLGHGSGYSVSHRFVRSGAVEFRVVLRADLRNERSTSPTVRVKVG